jgi:hypothetical protein
MNWTKQSQADAEASFRARIQSDKFATEQAELCKKLEVSPELSGEARVYASTHGQFFGCNSDKEEMWRKGRGWNDGSLTFYFDGDDSADSELIRLAWLFNQTSSPEEELPGTDASKNLPLMEYAVASQDFAAIDTNAINALTSKAPFNSSYAKAIINETLSILKWRKKLYEEAIDKLVKSGGEDYAKILREAPKKGFADWQKVTGPWKAELERSRAFEKKLSNPSRKVLAGCSNELFPDAKKLVASYKTNEFNALINQIASDPIASLLLSRLAVCFAYEKLEGGSGAIKDLVRKGRPLRGPRSMAYYAIVDAVVEITKDRPRLLVNVTNYHFKTLDLTDLYSREFSFSGSVDYSPETSKSKGFIKDVKKSKDGVEIVFKQQKYTYPELNCRDTRKPIRIRSDGQIEYEQYCVETGKMLTQDETPASVKVHPLFAAGLAAGAYVVVTPGPIPAYVKKKQNDKKIMSFYGFDL